jgi:hypothetical protein
MPWKNQKERSEEHGVRGDAQREHESRALIGGKASPSPTSVYSVEQKKKESRSDDCRSDFEFTGPRCGPCPHERDGRGGDPEGHTGYGDGARAVGCALPRLDGEAVQDAEGSEENYERHELRMRGGVLRPGRNAGRQRKDNADRRLARKPAANAQSRQVNASEVEQGNEENQSVFASRLRRHGSDQDDKNGSDERGDKQQRTAMARMEEMALAQRGMPGRTDVEETVRDVDQPGACAENRDRDQGNPQLRGTGKAPRPERGDGRRIETEEVPVNGNSPQP